MTSEADALSEWVEDAGPGRYSNCGGPTDRYGYCYQDGDDCD